MKSGLPQGSLRGRTLTSSQGLEQACTLDRGGPQVSTEDTENYSHPRHARHPPTEDKKLADSTPLQSLEKCQKTHKQTLHYLLRTVDILYSMCFVTW